MQSESAPQTAPSAPATILIVEDEVIVRMVTVETLQEEGFHVLDAGDGNEALKILHSGTKIDVLCSDVNLPDINGYALAAEALKQHQAIKVLMMTGYSKNPMPESMKAAGARTLYKPFDLDELAPLVREMLGISGNKDVRVKSEASA